MISELFGLIEKFLQEHGSAAALKEHLALIKAQQAALESENTQLRAENERLRSDLKNSEEMCRILAIQLEHEHEITSIKGVFCHHCGSGNVKRTGARPDPQFGSEGIMEALFCCIECGKISGVRIIPE